MSFGGREETIEDEGVLKCSGRGRRKRGERVVEREERK